jgi:protein-S-isoprenylcysteine O-methyltransferase
MNGWFKKILQALVVWSVVLGALAAAWPPALALPHLWALLVIGVAANALQPSYRLTEGSRTPEDRGTAIQILYTVYLVQLAALIELCLRRPALVVDAVAISAAAAMLGGLALRTWAVRELGKYFTWNVEVQADQRVIRSGPYRLLRHPSYTGALVTFLFACVLLRSWVAALGALVLLPLAFLRRIAHEEALLARALPGYADYARTTWRLVPFVY